MKARRIKRGTLASFAAVAAALALWAAPVYAVHNDGIFQLDGDAKAATCGSAFGGTTGCSGDDWDSLYTCTAGGGLGCTKKTPGVGNGAAAISDLVTDVAPKTIFRGGGSKDEKDLSEWKWTDGSVPDKDDLIEAFSALYSVGGDKVLYFGANRLAVNGDAQIGFWFFQKAVSLKSDGTFQDAQGNPAKHSIGDVLILSNFVQGGGSSNIQVYKVVQVTPGTCPAGSVESSAGNGDICLQQVLNGTAGANGVCNGVVGSFPADAGCAATNGGVVDALDPDFVPKSGAAGAYPIVGFFEGGLNLTDVGLGNECFPTFAVETRSSQSITAVLKDFTLGVFENCEAAIRTEIHSLANNSDGDLQGTSVNPGTSIHDVAIVTGTIGAPLPTGTVTFQTFATLDCTSGGPTQTVTLVVGATDSRAETTAITVAPGSMSYQATYNGDSNYPTPITSTCEPLTINKLNSSIATHILLAEVFGSCVSPPTGTGCEITDGFVDLAGATDVDVRDQAVVTGAGATPTGTVTFTKYPSGNCSGTGVDETVTLDGTAKALSAVFALGANGLSYKVTYSGDANYLPSSASRCEPVCAIDTTK